MAFLAGNFAVDVLGFSIPAKGGSVPPLALNAPMIFEKFAEAIAREALPNRSWR